MLKAFRKHFYNIALVIREFSKNSRMYQVSCAFLAASRLFQIVSFFLPLKILIMLSSDTPPAYLDYLPFTISYDTALIILILMVPAAYCGYIVSGVLHRYLLDKDLAKLKRENFTPKFIEIKSQKKILKLHSHVAKSFSEIILITLSLVLILYIDLPMFFFVLTLILVNLNIFVLKVFYKNDDDRIGLFFLHRRQYIEYISSMNFIFIFVTLALQVKYFEIGVFEALFIILLSRMMFQAMQRFSFENLHITNYLALRNSHHPHLKT